MRILKLFSDKDFVDEVIRNLMEEDKQTESKEGSMTVDEVWDSIDSI